MKEAMKTVHVQLYERGKKAPRSFGWPAVPIELHQGRTLHPDMWINCEEPYTVKFECLLAEIGRVDDEHLKYLHEIVMEVQNKKYQRPAQRAHGDVG